MIILSQFQVYNSIVYMSTNNFKNLIKTNLFTDDSFQPLLKKSEEYRKMTQTAMQHYQSMLKNFESYETTHEKILVDYEQYIQINEINLPQYFLKYIQLYRNIWSQQKSFNHKINNHFKQLNALCDSLFTNFSNKILTFQNCIRTYKAHENVLIQMSKKYFRTHKNMVNSIEYYKESFTDVRVIYNIDEKVKRYNTCETTYKTLQEELDTIEKKVTQLSTQKSQIIDSYKEIDKELVFMLKAVGNKLINVSKSFVNDFCQMINITVTYFAEKKYSLEQLELKTFFTADTNIDYEEYFNVEIDPKKIEFYPVFVVYYKNLKEECYSQLGNLLTDILKQTEIKIEKRKKLTKKVQQYTVNFIKLYEKHYYTNLKEVVSNFIKVKKCLTDVMGTRLGSFLKSCHSILELSIGINQKLIKRTMHKLKNIQTCLIQQIKTLDLFKNQFKINIQKFINNKNHKKIISEKEVNQFTEEEPDSQQISALKSSIADKSQHLSILIDGFVEKFKKNYDQIKFHYNSLVNDFTVSTNQFYSLCCDTQQAYFGQGFFAPNYQKYQTDIDNALQVQRKFFQQINFSSLLKDDQGPITFDGEMNKIEQYKKLKKPVSIEINQKQKEKESSRKGSGEDAVKQQSPEKKVDKKVEEPASQKGKNTNKHQEFLQTKITFFPGQKFFKSFSCALSNKILLSGRIYITNKRICFHSSFNPNNIFFDATFIQIPKQDIKKIEKKTNALVFDNSIAITTVNGEVFFTSFFSRNQAYDLICQALEIDFDECMFEPEQIKEADQVKQVPQQDDIKQEAIEERRAKINGMLSTHPYKQLFSTQFAYPGFNAYKFLKMFELSGEFNFNRKTYKSFAVYIKQCLEHKDYNFGEWGPSSPNDFLNSANIKQEMPLSFTRKINCMVPVANSGVPFMPKQAKSEQTQTLYIISKDQFIVESTIQNSGVPYADTFNLRLKKVVTSINQNACKMTVSLFINFISVPMVKAIIQSKSAEETKNAMSKFQAEAKKYLNYIERSRIKSKAAPSGQSQNLPNPQNQEYQKQIEELKDNEQKIQKELKASEVKYEQIKKFLMGSLVLNIILILILLA